MKIIFLIYRKENIEYCGTTKFGSLRLSKADLTRLYKHVRTTRYNCSAYKWRWYSRLGISDISLITHC